MARMVNLLFSFGETEHDANSAHVNNLKNIWRALSCRVVGQNFIVSRNILFFIEILSAANTVQMPFLENVLSSAS